jgi:hypothetical protein
MKSNICILFFLFVGVGAIYKGECPVFDDVEDIVEHWFLINPIFF